MSVQKSVRKKIRAETHSRLGRHLIEAMKHVEAHVKGKVTLPRRSANVADRASTKSP